MIIIHRCSCGHPDYHHDWPSEPNRGVCLYGACRATEHEYGPSELAPTFVGGERVELVHEPGWKLAPNVPPTCACDQCWSLYRQVTAP